MQGVPGVRALCGGALASLARTCPRASICDAHSTLASLQRRKLRLRAAWGLLRQAEEESTFAGMLSGAGRAGGEAPGTLQGVSWDKHQV